MPELVSGGYKLSEMASKPMMGNEPMMPKRMGAGMTPQGKSYGRPMDAMEPMGMADSRMHSSAMGSMKKMKGY